ncbi:hypothetical protein B0T16DRAFT_336955 [Cercophora newfieldiana]|uniref:SET domain-containing protein n=1 Tax=Cercophora newfieldiana TaxID=92897 RepID=A0AA40CI79_9PEZI|nr:hypothetical protein B0T16DRAFT_336955 [Cercophora newfieldiana]
MVSTTALLIISLSYFPFSQAKTLSQCAPPPTTPFPPQHNKTCPSAILDDTTPFPSHNATIPWTQPPYCIIPRSIGSTHKFCIYTSSSYNLGSGLSVLTTPEVAASYASAILDPLPAFEARHHLAHHGIQSPEQKSQLSYEVVPIPGKGLGVVATKHIPQFDIIMVSYPAMIIDNEFLPPDEDKAPVEGWRAFTKALMGLGDEERFLSMAKSKSGDIHVVEDLVRTNAFGLYTMGRDLKGAYPEVAVGFPESMRMCRDGMTDAASCSFPQYRSDDLGMRVIATRDIHPGEEITISYVPLGMPTAYRQRSFSNWSFKCTCALCTAKPEVRDASDARREQLADLYAKMEDSGTSHRQLVALIKEFDEIVDKEGLAVKRGEYYQGFMMFHAARGDWEGALKYGQQSLKYTETFSDPTGGFAGGLRDDVRYLKGMTGQKG